MPFGIGRLGAGFGHLGAVGNAAPAIVLSNTSIAQGSANGTTLGTASIAGHTTGTAAWSLTDGTGTFQINSATGVVTVLSNTDLASPGTISISISVSGLTPAVSTAHFTINVTSTGFLLEANFSNAQFEPWVFW